MSFCGAIEMAGVITLKTSIIKGGVEKFALKQPIFLVPKLVNGLACVSDECYSLRLWTLSTPGNWSLKASASTSVSSLSSLQKVAGQYSSDGDGRQHNMDA